MFSGARLFLIAIPLILVTAAGGAVGWWMAESGSGPGSAAAGSEGQALQSAAMTYAALEREHYRRLRVEARAVADGPAVVEYVTAVSEPGEASAPPDPSRLAARLRQAEADFAAVLDPAGQVLVSSDPGAGVPAVSSVPEDGPRQGLWSQGGRLLLTVTVPISPPLALPDAPLPGMVIVAEAVEGFLAREIAQISGGKVAFVVADEGTPTVVATSLETPGAWSSAWAADGAQMLANALRQGTPANGGPVELAGAPHRLRIVPLGDPPVGGLVVAAPPSALEASWWPLAGLAGGALAALLLALPLAWLLGSKSPGEALPALAEWVEQVRRGEASADQPPAGVRDDPESPAGRLVDGLRALVGDVEQERALRDLLAGAGGVAGTDAEAVAPERRPATLMAVELRRHARAMDPAEALAALEADLAVLQRLAASRGGRVEALAGHRVLLVFDGEDGVRRALTAAAEAVEELGGGGSAFNEVEPPPVALATGRLVTGSLVTADGPRTVRLGLPVQLLETVLREASAGQIYFSRDVHQALAEDLEGTDHQPAPQQGILTTQPLYGLTPRQARDVLGDAAPAPDDQPAEEGAEAATLAPGSTFADRFDIRSREEDGPLAWNYRAVDRELDQEVLLKLFRPGALAAAERLADLDSPLQAYRSFRHPHAARLFDFGLAGEQPFLTRRWVAGVHLGRLLQRVEPPAPLAALAAARQLAAALAAAHDQGHAHLRLKPTNLLFDLLGEGALVTDFGLATVGAPREAGGWAAPEQAEGQGDARSDVYTCGLLIHRLFVGAGGEQEPPAEVVAILTRCRADSPDDRFEHAGELAAALEALRL